MTRAKKFLAFSVFLATIAGCTGTGTVTGTLYPPQSGTINLTANNPPAGVTSVEFELDGVAIPGASQVAIGASFPFDTTSVPDGIHTLQALGNGGSAPVDLFTNTIVILNGAKSRAGATPTPVPTATPSAAATVQPSPTPTASADACATDASGICQPTNTASTASGTGSAF